MNKPQIKDLQNLITPVYASLWEEIGFQLNIPAGILEAIKIAYPTNPEWCCNKMWVRWCDYDTDASWHKVLKAIHSPAITALVKNFNNVSTSSTLMDKDTTLEAVSDLACRLKLMSIKNRYKIDDNWPLISPKHFTSVALIHHKGQLTKREVLAVASLLKRGDFDLINIHTADEYFKQSKCTKDISQIFKVECADGTTKFPSTVLIEGVPGIGKTTLSKEIVFQWANSRLLSDKLLVFLIHLRDTESHKINSLESFVNYVSYPQVAAHILQYIVDSKGKDIVIVFDGYDEISHELRNNSFHYKLMTQSIMEMPLCTVVITSRPNASACLHDKIDLRVEILGFTNKDRKEYIDDALKGDDNAIKRVVKYLNDNPSVDAYCYIPLNMTILLSFFKSSNNDVPELPDTQTGINEKFVCTTISRYIRSKKELTLNFSNFSEIQAPCDNHEIGTPCIGHEKGMPYGRILKEISRLAFKALEKDKIVFTTTELQESCPCLESYAKNWDGLGLLKAVQFFDFNNNLRNVSFNFLHFTIQEILAAYHITLMSEDDQIKCMRETFWNNRYYNTWIMYVGLTKNQLPITFKHFLSGNRFLLFTRFYDWWKNGTYCYINNVITDDKIKCLHLFQCFSEVENNDLCQYVGQLLQENKIDLSNQTLSAINVSTISLFLARSITKQWNILNLSECYIGDDGIKQLYSSFTSNNRSKVYIDKLNLSNNYLTRSSVEYIAGLILEWKVKDIILNDVNQNHLNEEIMYQIMQYPIEKYNFITCKINKNITLFAKLSEIEYLITGFSGSLSNEVVNTIATAFRKQQANTKDLKIVKFDSIICSLQNCTTITYLNVRVVTSQFKLSDLVKLIRNNKFMEHLDLSKLQCSILNEPIESKMVLDALKPNISLEHIDISFITIDSGLVKEIIAVLKNKSKLKEISISGLLLRHYDFKHLKNYLLKFTGLKLLGITGYIFTTQDADSLAIVVRKNYEIQQLNLSSCKIPMEHLLKILCYKSVVNNLKSLNLSGCQFDAEELKQILKQIRYLNHIDLSGNIITSDAVTEMVAMISSNQYIKSLSLPNCLLNQEELRVIIETMQTASFLQYVDFRTNEVVTNDVVTLCVNNSKIKQIKVSKLTLSQCDFQDLKASSVGLKGLSYLRITECTFTNQDLTFLETLICRNYNIQVLIITNCKINDQKMATTVTDFDGVFDRLEIVELKNNSTINTFVPTLLLFLSCSSKLKQIILCNCQLWPNEINQTLMVLKCMSHLECVDLSGNAMTGDSVSEVKAIIVSNKQLQKLYLPKCILIQTNLRIIVQAMQTISSLQYVDFSTNTLDDELACDVAAFLTNRLMELNFSKLSLNQSGFQCMKNYLHTIKGLQSLTITGCTFTRQDATIVTTVISNNSKIQEINLSNCRMHMYIDQFLLVLSYQTYLKSLDLSNCHLQVKQMFSILKNMKYLQHINLNGNMMTDDVANDAADMIITNKDIKKLYLPDHVLTQTSIGIIIKAMQTVSSLQYVNLGTITLGNELAKDVAILISNNTKLEQLKITELKLDQIGFGCLKTSLAKFHGIKQLSVTNCSFTDQDANNIAIAISNNANMQQLDLSNSNIFHILKKMSSTTSLQCLKLNGTTITDQMEDEVITIISNNNLQNLEMAGCNLSKNLYTKLIKCTQFKNISNLNFSHNSIVSKEIKQLLPILSSHTKLKSLDLSSCRLQSYEVDQLFNILKRKNNLQCINLSANSMTNDVAENVSAMIINNKDIQKLHLPNCTLDQSSLKSIIQALKVVTSLQYVDLSTNKVDDDLAKDIAALINNNNELKRLKFSQLLISSHCFQYLKDYLERIEGLNILSINYCNFSRQDADRLVTAGNHSKIHELSLSNCTVRINAFLSIISYNVRLRWLDLSSCHLHAKGIKRIFSILKKMNDLQYVNLSANSMTGDVAKDIAAMIIKNKNIQEIHLPDCVLDQTSITIIIQAMQVVSSLHYVDFSTSIIVDNELASDIALVITNNHDLKGLKFSGVTLNQNSFQLIKNYPDKLKLKLFTIVGFTFTRQDASIVKSFLCNNLNIQELNLSNCKLHKDELLPIILHWNKDLRRLDLSNCQLHSKKIKRIVIVLKQMNYLSHVDLSGNFMKPDGISEITTMIKENKHIQSLSLPKCSLSQKDLRSLIQAMHSVSSLQYVDFNNNRLENELASDVAHLMTNNSELRELKFFQVTLNHSGFQHLSNCLEKIKVIQLLSITNCFFTREDGVKMLTAFNSNSEIQEIDLSNCVMPADQSLSILSYITKLKWLNLSNCLLQSNEITKIFSVLKEMEYLQHIDLSANNMKSDAINEIAAMIKNNKHIQLLSLPTCVLDQKDISIIIQAMHTISSLQHIEFNTLLEVDNELACDIATLFASNRKLQQLNVCKLKLKQSGFQHLKTYFLKLKGLRYLTIVDVTRLINPDMFYMENVIGNNEIQELIISNCRLIDYNVITVAHNTDIYYHENQLKYLELSNNSAINTFISNMLPFLLYGSKLKQIILCNCQLQPKEIKQIFMVLKYMRDLECVDLSGNAVEDDSISEIKAMIDNNKKLQKLCLPNGTLNQKDLRIIIQAMQTILSLQFLDFNVNKINSGLASDVAILIDNNTKLEVIKFSSLELDQNGFNFLKSCLIIFKEMKHIKITSCTFFDQDIVNVAVFIDNNLNVEELDLSYSKGDMLCIVSKLKTLLSLKCLKLNKFTITEKVEHEIIIAIHHNCNLEYLEMSGCNLSSNFIKAIGHRNIQFKF